MKKEILFIKHDLNKISVDPKRYKLVMDAYKKRLVELGVMKEIKDRCITKEGKLIKKSAKTQKNTKDKKETKKKTEKKVKEKVESKATKSNKKEEIIETAQPRRRGRPRKNA